MSEKVYLIRESTLKKIADEIRSKRETTELIPVPSLAPEVAAIEDLTQTYILQDEAGNEVTAVLVESETVFDARENDIREGKVAVTDQGVTMGTKAIPSYHTTEGYRLITSGSEFATIPLEYLDLYDFTKLQVIICPWAGSLNASVAAEKIAINDSVYAANSTEILASVSKDSESKTIKLNITNESEILYVMRYFTYKEIN